MVITDVGILRDWSLVTVRGGGGLQNLDGGGGGGVACEVYPYEKGGGGIFSHAEGGHNKFWGSFYVAA